MTPNKLQVKKSSQGDVKLALLDERYKTMCQDINELKNDTKEIKDTVSGLKSSIDTLPEKLDQRYAKKGLEEDIKKIMDKTESRNYEWLRYLIVLVIGALLTYLGIN